MHGQLSDGGEPLSTRSKIALTTYNRIAEFVVA